LKNKNSILKKTSKNFVDFGASKVTIMPLGTILLIILILLLIGALPNWPHSQTWGYIPSGGLGLILIIVLILVLLGRL
jgi:hypothetical protein